ncbi:hypothetical protein H310_05880 [Aphanomyces invadans]|uniref:Uncharacterized protein n=1 Tax=Aphanomyces invadans TaxID=157072 RepID=A0A024U9Q9_9STRA|nr:hypothetical protein H310_05880 [Aphanomyces invadans]ETW02343.1 hypothetical protein H310_05880 [Aphanomyces invadans]|eukprot:XP_008868948.1 hypothetical protein H310_05880 [Aphanomyces invadans]
MVPPDLPPLEVLSDEELHHITSSTSSGHTKSTSEVAMKSNPPAAAAASTNPKKHPPPDNPLFVHAVIVVLMLYLAACAYAYLCPLEGIPWEVEFALPTQNISSNCTVTILHPLEGQVTSRNVIEFELHAPSNTTNSSQIMQYTIQVDGVLFVTDLAILHRRDPIPFSTNALHTLASGDHVVTITLVVPLPGGREDVVHVERRFHLVPPGSPIFKLSLPQKSIAPSSPEKTCDANLSDGIEKSDRHVIRSPSNGSAFPREAMIAFDVDAVHVMELTVLLDGVKVQTLPPSTDAAATKQVHRGVLVGLHPGHHTLHIRGLHDDNDIDNVWFHILETN